MFHISFRHEKFHSEKNDSVYLKSQITQIFIVTQDNIESWSEQKIFLEFRKNQIKLVIS